MGKAEADQALDIIYKGLDIDRSEFDKKRSSYTTIDFNHRNLPDHLYPFISVRILEFIPKELDKGVSVPKWKVIVKHLNKSETEYFTAQPLRWSDDIEDAFKFLGNLSNEQILGWL